MNPNHLTKNVIEQVTEAVKAQRIIMKEKNSKGIQKAFDGHDDIMNFFTPYYEKVKNEVDNNIHNFLNLIALEFQYGFVSGYIGGANINPDGTTTIKIG